MSNKKDLSQEAEANLLYVLMQPARQKIIKLLLQSKPLYIEQIAERIGMDRRSVSFHLATLAEKGFVEGQFEMIVEPRNPSRGRAAKFYKVTPKVKNVITKWDALLEATKAIDRGQAPLN